MRALTPATLLLAYALGAAAQTCLSLKDITYTKEEWYYAEIAIKDVRNMYFWEESRILAPKAYISYEQGPWHAYVYNGTPCNITITRAEYEETFGLLAANCGEIDGVKQPGTPGFKKRFVPGTKGEQFKEIGVAPVANVSNIAQIIEQSDYGPCLCDISEALLSGSATPATKIELANCPKFVTRAELAEDDRPPPKKEDKE